MMQISLRLPRKLMNDLDDIANDLGYQARSKVMRDALNDYIIRYNWMNEVKGKYIGVLTVKYNLHSVGVMENLREVQHDFSGHIKTSIQIHISKDYCLEIIVLKGDVKYIRTVTGKVMGINGVEHVKLSSTTT